MSATELFETLDPPPGGWTRLRARIRQDRRRRFRRWSLATAATGVAVVALALLLRPADGRAGIPPALQADLVAIRMGLVDPPAEVVSIRPDLRRRYAVQRIPTTNDRVVLYLVGSRH